MRRLRKQCERRLKEIGVPRPFDLREFCDRVAKQRGRTLSVRPEPGLSIAAPCGMWLSIGNTDYILYEPNTSRLHSEHIVLHELGHVLSGHMIGLSVKESVLAELMPNIDPRTIKKALGRVAYTTEQELEAEMLASMIVGWDGYGRDDRSRDELDRISDAFCYHGN